MALRNIMNGTAKGQAPQNKIATKPYSGGSGYNTKPIRNSGVISDDGDKDYGV